MIVIKKQLVDDYIKYTRDFFSDAVTMEDMTTHRDMLFNKIWYLYKEKQISLEELMKYSSFLQDLTTSCIHLNNIEIYKMLEEYRLIKTIAMSEEAFQELIEEITDGLVTIDYSFGIYLDASDKAKETEMYWEGDIKDTLSKHFDVEVTSWHSDADTHDFPMIFICYK